MANCAVIPKVKNNKGEIVDSTLFKDLLSYTNHNRDNALKLYLITKNNDFITKWNLKLKMDSNNEPTIKSLLDVTDFNKVISESVVLEILNRDIGHYKKGSNEKALKDNTSTNFDELVDKAIKFNLESDYKEKYTATVFKTKEDGTDKVLVGIKIERRNTLNSLNSDKMEYNKKLNDKLKAILEAKGVSIGALEELERRMGIAGVTDFDKAKTAAEGLKELIRLAEGIKGEKALPEEFAHFAIEAMGNSPLINRLINLIIDNKLTKQIIGDEYSDYKTLYKSDEVKLAKEAAGKLLAKHLLRSEKIQDQSKWKTILMRVIDGVKNFFREFNINDITRAMYSADKEFSKLSTDILTGELTNQMQISNISTQEKFYRVVDRNEKLEDTLNAIIDNETRRLHIYKLRSINPNFEIKQISLINELERNLNKHQEVEGISLFLSNALEVIKSLNEKIEDIKADPSMDINKKAGLLRDIRNYMYSYDNILTDVSKSVYDEEEYADDKYADVVKENIKDIRELLSRIHKSYNDLSMDIFVKFLRQFIGDSVEFPFGKYKGKTIKIDDDFITTQSKDISFFDRWLDSMADSSNLLLRVIDKAVKTSKENARLNTIEMSKRLKAAGILYEQESGSKDYSFMFEKLDDGSLTGFYIREINEGLYKSRRNKMYKELEREYGKNPIGADAKNYEKERKKWYDANTEIELGVRVPKKSIYINKDYENMTDPQKKLFKTIMDIKTELDAYLPTDYTTLENAVKIRKDLIERVKSSDSIKSGGIQIWESIKDTFIKRMDDTGFSDKASIKDFDNREVQILPIYYTKLGKGESPNDISTDVISTMCAYAAMAIDFNEMNKVVDCLEVGRDIMREKTKPQQQSGNKPVVEVFKELGRKVESKIVKSSDNRILQRLDDYYEMQVYGRYTKDEGNFGNSNINKGKTVNFINLLTAVNSLGFSLLNGISNIATGTSMMRIESISNEFFKYKDQMKADEIYVSAMGDFIGDTGKRVKTSKLNLFDELFNVLQNYETEIKDSDFNKTNIFVKLFSSHPEFVLNHAGEHWMQNRTALALANAYKMKDDKGNEVTLWNALEVEYIDKNNKALGAKLKIKKGYTKMDGTEFTRKDIRAFSQKSASINQHMHGIYNDLDKSAIQNVALGRMAILFRKWMVPSINKRFSDTNYNLMTESFQEGYYVTAWNFIKGLAKDIKEGDFNYAARKNSLSKEELSNLRKAKTEIIQFLVLLLAMVIIKWPKDKKNRPWALRMAEYQMYRLKNELGVLIPGFSMVKEGLKIVQSPAAGFNTINDSFKIIKLLYYPNYTNELQSGRFKGHSTAYKTFMESPLLPMNKSIYRSINPETGLPFFKQW